MSKNNRSYVLQVFVESAWAILPHKLTTLAEIVNRHVNGEKLSAEEIEARIQGTVRPQERRVNKVAVLPLFGVIFPRGNLMVEMSGATSAERFSAQFDALLKDPEIDAIVLDVNSPGGSASGTAEAAAKIYEARGQKRIIAISNHMMASGAYWIGCAAGELVVSPSSEVGSIGVYAAHQDVSVALEQEGVKVSLISAGKYKTAGNPYEPLTEETRAVIQKRVDDIYDQFVGAVAQYRGVKEAVVRNGFGEGGVVGADEAVALGMADRVATLEEVLNGLFGGSNLTPNPSPKGEGNHTNQLAEGGQAPASVQAQTRLTLEREKLAVESAKVYTGESTMLRELIKQRSEKVARAQALVDGADKEARDMTDDERKEFVQLLGEEAGIVGGEVGALDVKIEQMTGEREKLRAAAEKKFMPGAESAQKPEAQGSDKMKMADFRKLDPGAQMNFIKSGGKLED